MTGFKRSKCIFPLAFYMSLNCLGLLLGGGGVGTSLVSGWVLSVPTALVPPPRRKPLISSLFCPAAFVLELPPRSFDVHTEAHRWSSGQPWPKNCPPVRPTWRNCWFCGASSPFKHTSVLRYPRPRHIAEKLSAVVTCDALFTWLPAYGWSDQAAFPGKMQTICCCFVVRTAAGQEGQTCLVRSDDCF